MLPPIILHDPNALRELYAPISLSACRNSHSPCHTNITDPPNIGCSQLSHHPSCRP